MGQSFARVRLVNVGRFRALEYCGIPTLVLWVSRTADAAVVARHVRMWPVVILKYAAPSPPIPSHYKSSRTLSKCGKISLDSAHEQRNNFSS